jgi:hypothetical protein
MTSIPDFPDLHGSLNFFLRSDHYQYLSLYLRKLAVANFLPAFLMRRAGTLIAGRM